jgi:putative aminopeptidase FrvX
MTNLGGDPEGGVVFKLFGDLMRDGYVTPPDAVRFLPRVYLKPATINRLLALSETGKLVEFSETRRMKPSRNVECENIVALWPGRDPERSRKAVIVSAHYDHVGVDRRGRIHNGADDNGSGTAGLLALADALVALGPLEYSVFLVWLSGEEKGLWGSEALVRNPGFASGVRPAANINLDMIGRNDGRQLLLTPFDENHPKHSHLAALARSFAPEEGFTDLQSGDPYFERSDQASFAKLGIPVVFLTDGMHADYHQPTDDAERIDAGKIERVIRLVFRMLEALQHGNDSLTR